MVDRMIVIKVLAQGIIIQSTQLMSHNVMIARKLISVIALLVLLATWGRRKL